MLRKLARLRADTRGNALVLTAAALPLVVGAAGFGVDTISLALAKSELQREADSAAMAGAYSLFQHLGDTTSDQEDAIETGAARAIQLNSLVALSDTPLIERGSFTVGGESSQAVRVRLTATKRTPFMAIFTGRIPTITAEARAALVNDGEFCMLALGNSGVDIDIGGSATVTLGCGIASNSTSSPSIKVYGSASVTASPVYASGTIIGEDKFVGETEFVANTSQQPDPLATLRDPTDADVASCNNKVSVGPTEGSVASPVLIYPGCYKGLDIKGVARLAPGTYYIAGNADFDVGAQGHVFGTGVTIIMTSLTPTNTSSNYAGLSINAGAIVDLTAPSSGDYKGILFYRDRRAPAGSYTINGNAGARFEGSFYFPKDALTFNGSSDMDTKCLQMISSSIKFTGNSGVSNVCPAEGAHSYKFIRVRLVA